MLPKKFFNSFIAGLGSLTLALVVVGCSTSEISFRGRAASPADASRQKIQSLAQEDNKSARSANFEATFQDGTTGDWDTRRHLGSKKYFNDPHHYSFQMTKDRWSDDKFAGRFEIRGDDQQISDGWRSEFKDGYRVMPGDHLWYSFEFLIPEDFITRGKSVVIAQWHDKKVDDIPAQRPQLSVRVVAGDLHVYLWNDPMWEKSCAREECGEGSGNLIYSGPLERERWHKIELEAVWSAGDDGYLELKLDGQTVATHQGSTTYAADVFGPYFKLGVYTVHSFEDPMVVYHKNYKRRDLKLAPQSIVLPEKRDRWASRRFYLEAA
jgi:Polysaccharide lyase